jgi:alkylated DNA repair dioxygenase AlkB
MCDAAVVLHRGVFGGVQHDRLFANLRDSIAWERHMIHVYGRTLAAPRLSAWYGDPGAVYRYSGIRLEPLAWTPPLLEIKSRVEALVAARFNGVLLNLYRNGQDSVGWHSDAEAELGRNPAIASVSLGAVRRFVFQHKKRRHCLSLDLEPGSVLIMAGSTQHYWRHQLPKTRRPVGARINLSFRAVR